jgi:DNA-directed RNA polymerase specialized sigma24 family protein
VDQFDHVDPALAACGSFHVRTAFHPSRECQQHGQPAQDYLTYAASRSAIWWAVADGVSGSFCGDIAARVAADAVVAWLSGVSLAAADGRVLDAELCRVLAGAVSEGGGAVGAAQLPAGLHPVLRASLERLRAAGSESMIACGRIERETADPDRLSFFVASLGDMRTRWQRDGEAGELARRTEDRWSSRLGIVGHPSCLLVAGASRLHLMAYSDGLAAIDDRGELTTAELEDRIEAARAAPTSDDLCLFEVWSREPSHLREALPPPGVQVAAAGDGVQAAWPAVPGATHYVVELSGRETDRFQVTGERWRRAGLAPGEYGLRVYGVQQRAGRRSDQQRFAVPDAGRRLPPVSERPAPPVSPVPSVPPVPDQGEADFETLVGRLADPARRIARALLASDEDADEALRQARAAAWGRLGRIQPGRGFGPWYLTIVFQRCRAVRRRGRWRTAWAVVTRRERLSQAIVAARRSWRRRRRLGDRARVLSVALHHLGMPADRVAWAVAAATGRDERDLLRVVERLLDPAPAGRIPTRAAGPPRPRGPAALWSFRVLVAVLVLAVAAFIAVTLAGARGPARPTPARPATPSPSEVTTPVAPPIVGPVERR